MGFAHIAQAMQKFGHTHGYGGFTGIGVAGKVHIQGGCFGGERKLFAQSVHQKQCRDLADAGFYRLQTDQLAVEFVEYIFYIRGFKFGFQINRRVVR